MLRSQDEVMPTGEINNEPSMAPKRHNLCLDDASKQESALLLWANEKRKGLDLEKKRGEERKKGSLY